MTFGALALVCVVALLGPILSIPRWLHLPVVVGELVVGILLGPTGPGILDAGDPTFHLLGQLGFALVMFAAGSRVPLRSPGLRRGLLVGVLRAVGVGVLAVPVAYALSHAFGSGHVALYAVLLASSSASLVMPALEGVPTTGRPVVELLPQLVVADTACILALPLAVDPARAGWAFVGAVLVLGAGLLAFLALRWLVTSGRQRRVHDLSEDRGLAIELRVALTLVFGLSALATWRGVSVLLAGFVAGLAVAAAGEPRRVGKQVFALTEGLFGPIFFVWLGSSLDLSELADHPSAVLLGLALGAAALLVHSAPALFGQPWPVAVLGAAELGVPVAAVGMGASVGGFGTTEAASVLLGALVTVVGVAVVSGRVRALAVAAAKAEGENGTTAPPPGGPAVR